MAQLFYRIDSGAVHVASIGSIDSLSSGAIPYDSIVTTGTSRYSPFVSINITTTYPHHGCYCYNTSGTSTNIYYDIIKNAYDALPGTDIVLPIDSTLVFCDSKGKESSIAISLTLYNATQNYTFSLSPSVTWGISGSVFKNDFYKQPPHIKIICDSDNNLGLAMYNETSAIPTNQYVLAAPDDLLYNALSSYTYGASGSDSGESSGESGGAGFYNFENTDVSGDDDMPGSSPAIATGLVNPYYVTASEIASLGAFLWSSNFFDSIAKTFLNPMDCIISLSSFPLASSSMSLGSSESVRVGNTTSSSTGTRLISEFVTIDCGTVSVPEVWGSYLDYAQTKLYIYIPYLGIEELPLCECMGGTVACSLRINLLTGALVACVTLTSGTYVTGSARVQPIYFSTTCKSDIPVSGATTGALAGAFQLLGGAVSSVAGIATGVAPLAISGLASAAQGVATMQSQNSQISGAVGAAGGQMAHKIPFLIFDRPVQSVPANLASVAGYQSNSGTTLSRCSGFVICDTINLDGLALTRSELEEVEQICTSGVYIS